MSDLDIRYYDTATYYVRGDWFELVSRLLMGAPEASSKPGTDAFVDAFTGMKLTISSDGDTVTDLAVSGRVPVDGRMVVRPLAKLSVADGALSRDALVGALEDHINSNGFDTGLSDLVSQLSVRLEMVDNPDFGSISLTSMFFEGSDRDDVFIFGDYRNTLISTPGNDTYVGGSGVDVLYYYFETEPLTLTIDGAGIRMHKPDGSIDSLSGIEELTGGYGDDDFRRGLGDAGSIIKGFEGNDVIGGGRGRDYLVGGEGDDTLYGRAGADLLVGYYGDDTLRGGRGRDILVGTIGFNWFADETDHLRGGRGADLFVIAIDEFIDDTSRLPDTLFEVIEDFRDGRDLIGLVDRGWNSPDPEDWVDFVNLDIRDTDDGAIIAFRGLDMALVVGTAAADLTREDFVQRVDLQTIGIPYEMLWA